MKKLHKLIAATVVAKLLILPTAAFAGEGNIQTFIYQLWQNNLIVQEAEAQVDVARAEHRAASKWMYNPELELGLESKDGEDKTKSIGVSQTIDWNGKSLASGKVASFELKAAMAKNDSVREDLALDTLMALSDYRSAKNTLSMAMKRADLMHRFSKLVKNSFDAGDVDQSEYNLARLALSEALIQSAEAEANVANIRQSLSVFTGFMAQQPLPDLPEKMPTPPAFETEINELLKKLPSIRQSQNEHDAAQAEIKRARLGKWADPTVGIQTGEEEGVDLVGISLSVPLNVFNNFQAEVDVAKNESLAKGKALQNMRNSAKAKIIASRRSYELTHAAWNGWQETGRKALAEQMTILDKKFEVGELSSTDYLVHVQQTLDTEIAAIELQNKVWQSWFSWLAASGTIKNWLGEIK